MKPSPAQIALPVAGLLLVGGGLYAWRRRKIAPSVDGVPPPERAGVLPAYPRIVSATPQQRAAILAAADAIGADPAALATVIELESGWDPTAPHSKTGTPRAGLNQITLGAHMPGIDTAEKVWALRDLPMEQQLTDLVVPYFQRMRDSAGANWKPDTACGLYKLNFLPALAGKPDDYHLGEKDSDELVGGLSKGKIYAANPAFDSQKKGYFTWADVCATLASIEKHAHGQVIDVAGNVTAPQIAGVLPVIGATREPGIAPALTALLDQIDAIWPHRNTASDGAIGDSDEPDHASGNAIDVTNDPTNGPDLRALAEILLSDPRTHYVIFDSRIANRDAQGGAWRPYPEREEGESVGDYEKRAKLYNKHSRHIHISIRRSGRADGSRWPRGAKDNSALASAARTTPLSGPASIDRLPGLLAQGIGELWPAGLVDNFRWVPLKIGEYEIEVTSDAAAAYGLRIPASFDDVLAMAGSVRDIIPPTKAIVDARWKHAAKRIVLDPIPGGAHKADGKDPIGVQQVQEWDARLGPVSPGPLYDGGWKEWILEEGIPEGHAVNYGLRKADGSVWQPPGHAHDAHWLDYSQLQTFVKRKAKKSGVEVDLLDEIAKGSPLGGPLPQWIVERLNGESHV